MPESANSFFTWYHTLTSVLCRWCALEAAEASPRVQAARPRGLARGDGRRLEDRDDAAVCRSLCVRLRATLTRCSGRRGIPHVPFGTPYTGKGYEYSYIRTMASTHTRLALAAALLLALPLMSSASVLPGAPPADDAPADCRK